MSSQEQVEVPLGHVLLKDVVEGDGMDESILDSSDREDGEQGRKADKAMHKENGTPIGTDTVKSVEEMEVADNDNPKVGTDNPTTEDKSSVISMEWPQGV